MTNTVVQQIDTYGATLQIVRRRTDAGLRADQVTIRCPKNHPTGVTVTMLQAITASLLRGDTKKPVSVDKFVAGLTPTRLWVAGERNRTTDGLLGEVAEVYRKALVAQLPPLQVVAHWLGSSVPTASNLIREARRRQLIREMPRPGRPMKKSKEP